MERPAYNWSNTERMDQYGHAMENSMVAATGKTLQQWVEIAKSCPETAYRKRLDWFKNSHGIMQNRAIMIFSALDGKSMVDWDQPEQLFDNLFAKYQQLLPLAHELLGWVSKELPSATLSPRKAYLGIHNRYQFAVLAPNKAGLQLGVHVPKGAQPSELLTPLSKPLGGGDRIKHAVLITTPADISPAIKQLLADAFAAS